MIKSTLNKQSNNKKHYVLNINKNKNSKNTNLLKSRVILRSMQVQDNTNKNC